MEFPRALVVVEVPQHQHQEEQVVQQLATWVLTYDYENTSPHFFQSFQLQWKGSKQSKVTREEMMTKRFVDNSSPNARFILKSFLPAAVQKCVFYSLSQQERDSNVSKLKMLLDNYGIPRQWISRSLQFLLQKVGIG